MWTERKEYWKDIQVINVFVANPTDVWWNFGRDWSLSVWNGTDWVNPAFKQSLSWTDDAFGIDKAPLFYCFRFPVGEYYHLPKGKYRLAKRFRANGKNLRKVLKEKGVLDSAVRTQEIGDYWRKQGEDFLISKQFDITLTDFKQIDKIIKHIDTKDINTMLYDTEHVAGTSRTRCKPRPYFP